MKHFRLFRNLCSKITFYQNSMLKFHKLSRAPNFDNTLTVFQVKKKTSVVYSGTHKNISPRRKRGVAFKNLFVITFLKFNDKTFPKISTNRGDLKHSVKNVCKYN